jgi:hypothetical protein
MCLRLLRAEIWAQDDVKKLHRITVRTVPDGHVDGPAVVVVSRLVVTGGNHHRLHEELTVSGGYLRDQSFRREEGVTRVQQWLDESKPITAAPSLFDALRVRFDRQQEAILKPVDARSKERLRYLTNTLQTRKQQEIDDIGTVLDELEKAIQSELKKGEQPEQLSLFTEDERTQLRRDIAALEARLARIPDERQDGDAGHRSPLRQARRPHLPGRRDLRRARVHVRGGEMMTWQEYQEAVAEFYEHIDDFGNVRRNVMVPDKITGQPRQIDVLIEIEAKGHPLKMIVDAKFHAVPIDVREVESVLALS